MSEPASPDPRASRLHGILNVLGVYVLVGIFFALGCLMPDRFLTRETLLNILREIMLLGIVCTGVAFITYSRHYVDLSIPGIMALSGIVAVSMLTYGFVVSLAAGLAAGMAIGVINGLVIGYLRLNPIIWTLAMMSVLSGLIRQAYGGRQVYPDEATQAGRMFLDLYHTEVFGVVPLPAALLVVLVIAGDVLMRRTAFGAHLKLTGSSYEVARMTGVNVRRVVATAFILSALASALAGILLTSFNKVGAAYIGRDYDFQAITAVVLGGMTLAGGRGSIVGVMGGVMVIALMNKVMSLVRIGEFVIGDFQKNIILGAVFILVVGISSFSRRKSGLDDA
ncbi:MAG: ABC transporter permease [Planctomycetota bacterium]|nr:ABC transporter permease [Planctomycetota bacterium]